MTMNANPGGAYSVSGGIRFEPGGSDGENCQSKACFSCLGALKANAHVI